MTKRMLSQSTLSAVLTLFTVIALSACGLKKNGGLASSSVSCTPSGLVKARVSAYAKTVYPYTNNCASCHTATIPRFQESSPETGWANLVEYFGSEEPLNEVRTKVAPPLNHNTALLSGGVEGLDAQIATFDNLMNQYDAFCAAQSSGGGGNTGGSGGGNTGGGGNNPTVEDNRRFTAATNLGTLNATLASRTFQMQSGTTAPFNTIQIQADFRLFDAGGKSMVLMKNIRVSSPTKAVRIRNIRFKVNNEWKWDDYVNYAALDASVAQSTTQTSISGDSQLLADVRPNSSDTLVISAQIDETTVTQTELQVFVADVKPILLNQCAGCHSGVASYRFNTTTTDQALRDLTVAKISRTAPATSVLFQKAQLSAANGGVNHNGSANGTKPLQNDTTSVNKILNWISKIQ